MEVLISSAALEQFVALPRAIQVRVLKMVERLRDWPQVSGAKSLSGDLSGNWRLRTGDYRVQFRLEGRRVIVDRIGHRDGFYDE
jgi:mRNA-degrading endonuclease RelE of RelBE toxin-antitoxin system